MAERSRSTVCGRSRRRVARVAACALIWTASLFAEPLSSSAQQVPADPSSTHIFPAGARRGTTVPVRVGGECLPPFTRFRIAGDGVTAPVELGPKAAPRGEPSPRRKPGETHTSYPREWSHSIAIAAAAPPGMALWHLSCDRGGTGGRAFLVGDLPEFIETESNSTFERAEEVSLPVTINGQIDGECDLDYYRFRANAGDVVTADLLSRRLGSPMEPVAAFYDEQGRRLVAEECRAGSDPVLALCAPRSGTYRLLVSNLGVEGGPQFVYRVTLSTRPYARFAFPAGLGAGSAGRIDLFALTGTQSLRTVPWDAAQPAGARGDRWFYANTPTFNPLVLEATNRPVALDGPANDAPAAAQTVHAPCQIYGRFESAADEDWYAFSARKGSHWSIECRPLPAGSACMPILVVADASGRVLASASTADEPRAPCHVEWTAPDDGTYRLRLRDVQQGIRGGPEFIYGLSLAPSEPGFELRAATDFANVIIGARSEFELKVLRKGGFAGPIDLRIDGLPAHVAFEPRQIPAGQNAVRLVFSADKKALPGDVALAIRGVAESAGKSIAADLRADHLGRDAEGASAGPPDSPRVRLTVRDAPRLRLYCSEAYQYAYRGTVYPYLMEVERQNGYDGPIHLEVADRQIKDLDGIEVRSCTIEPGQSRILLPLYLPETMHINVQAHSNVYAQAYVIYNDAAGHRQSQLFVSEMRCMVRPLPSVVKLGALDREVRAQPGAAATVRLKLDRTSLFGGPMKVELIDPPPESGWRADAAGFGAGQARAAITVHRPGGSAAGAPRALVFRAMGDLPGYVGVISQTSVPLAPE